MSEGNLNNERSETGNLNDEKEKKMADGVKILYGFGVAALMAGSVLGIVRLGMDISGPSQPLDFNEAAQVGQVTQKQAVEACGVVEAKLNEEINVGIGRNKFPRQRISFNCDAATVSTTRAVTPAGP